MYSGIPESLEVRAFAATQLPEHSSGKTWHGTPCEALQLRRAIHQQVCRLDLQTSDVHGVCRPKSTPLFSQKELDRLVFVRRHAERYAGNEFGA
jgi:hypothetical protein